jgi:dienelactone hydrolase
MKHFLLLLMLSLAVRGAEPMKVRGMLPWHNFLSGPTAWNERDWKQYLDWMQQRGLNLLALHCYTGGAQRYVNYVEPLIRIEYRNVVPEAFLDTSATARWGYRPMRVDDFVFGTGKLFGGLQAFGADAAVQARDNDDRYRRAQGLIRKVFEMAHERGIQTGIGFEFGVYPPELFSIVPQDSLIRGNVLPDPTHPASQEILRLTIDDILRAYPGIDWVWLWMQEHEAPVGKASLSAGLKKLVAQEAPNFPASDDAAFTGAWSLEYIRSAHAYLAKRAPKVRIALSGWGGGRQLPGYLAAFDRRLPSDIVLTCLNPAQGLSPQPAIFEEIAKHRQVWAIPWLEGDAKLWHPQPRVSLLREQVRLARKQGIQGTIAIHWRTEDIRANMEAFARFTADPDGAPEPEAFYSRWVHEQYGAAAAPLAPILVRMDRERWFESLRSMEYYPYDPTWGQLASDLHGKLRNAAAEVDRIAGASSGREQQNLRWLAANFHFSLLLDQTSRALEPAYNLKAGSTHTADTRNAAARALDAAPLEFLVRTYASRVRSRGELGVLSSLNQRVWQQYAELRTWINTVDPSRRLNQHKVTMRESPAPEPGAEKETIPSLIDGLKTPEDWYTRKRPELVTLWTKVLGKLGPNAADARWFGDIRQARIIERREFDRYTRIRLDLPIEKDFYQPHVLLVPRNQGPGPFPAVIAWTSTTPDYNIVEDWWGRWLVERGHVVLASWAFIRNYRDGTTYRNGASEKLYERFGHWLPMAKMVHDAQREAEYLRSLREVDAKRIGFMGFSLSAKSALYIAAFAPEIAATVAIDPHIAVNGGTNWYYPWYLDFVRPFPDIDTPEHTVLSLLNTNPARPGLEHDHHELLALAAPRPLLIIGGCASCEDNGGHSDDRQSWGYINRAKQVYRLLGVPERLQFVLTDDGHHANGPAIDPAWQEFMQRWLR